MLLPSRKCCIDIKVCAVGNTKQTSESYSKEKKQISKINCIYTVIKVCKGEKKMEDMGHIYVTHGQYKSHIYDSYIYIYTHIYMTHIYTFTLTYIYMTHIYTFTLTYM